MARRPEDVRGGALRPIPRGGVTTDNGREKSAADFGWRSSWEEACLLSRHHHVAISQVMTMRHNGRNLRAEIVKPRYGDGWWVYQNSPGFKIRAATATEIDAVRRWKPFS